MTRTHQHQPTREQHQALVLTNVLRSIAFAHDEQAQQQHAAAEQQRVARLAQRLAAEWGRS